MRITSLCVTTLLRTWCFARSIFVVGVLEVHLFIQAYSECVKLHDPFFEQRRSCTGVLRHSTCQKVTLAL
jgi:hypothetical protein